MAHRHNPYLRFGLTESKESRLAATITNAPPLPAVDFAAVGQSAPTLLTTQAGALPKASAVVITWAEAEWAAMQHVFCAGATTMAYSDRARSNWSGWHTYAKNLPADAPSGWSEWGSYRLVEIAGKSVLLFKSNTHLDFPGASFLEALIKLLIADVQPTLILSIGTAGGAIPADHIGTVRAVSAGTLYEAGEPAASWPDYSNAWSANDAVLSNPNLPALLFPVPTTSSDLQLLASSLNRGSNTDYNLDQLDPDGLNLGEAVPLIIDQTGGGTSLLTASTFVVGTTAGDYQAYSAIEMDDAVIGEVCAANGTAFGFIRNVSDPVQNAALPAAVQGNWGSLVYDAYGLYTSYNGAIAAWAVLAAGIG